MPSILNYGQEMLRKRFWEDFAMVWDGWSGVVGKKILIRWAEQCRILGATFPHVSPEIPFFQLSALFLTIHILLACPRIA